MSDNGHRQFVRNGHLYKRRIMTQASQMTVKQPWVRDRRLEGDAGKFTAAILSPYLRKSKVIEELIPWLYLKGMSIVGFGRALQALVGADAAGSSASTITRLLESWQDEHEAWSKRSLEGKEYVYIWATACTSTSGWKNPRIAASAFWC